MTQELEQLANALNGKSNLRNTFDKCISILADNGWYISKTMSIGNIFNSTTIVIKEGKEAIDKAMCNYYKNNFSRVIDEFISDFPERKEIIKQAKKCHDKKMFFASTILFTSQADGICEGFLFKIKRKRKDGLKSYLEKNNAPDYITKLLIEIRGIDAFFEDNHLYNSDFNRHGIMHGLDNEYGNEINSYKALSLLSFVSNLFTRNN
ncbi:MAG: hypothetical protein J0M08_09810 [Bacteroidetes bacterium]|nr:hypothetical protein [Bacteroidota bacterium]